MEPDLEEIRRRKLLEYQKKLAEQQELQRQQIQAELQIRAILKRILEPDAFERLGRVKLANPELYARAVQYLIALYQAGRIPRKLKDGELKVLLARLTGPKRETKIRILDKG